MSNDDLYQIDGETYTNGIYYPEVPTEQAEAEKAKQGKMASSYPVMDDVADWFKEQIELADSVQYVKSYADVEKVPIEDTLRAFDIVRLLLETKSHEFAEFGKEAGRGK